MEEVKEMKKPANTDGLRDRFKGMNQPVKEVEKGDEEEVSVPSVEEVVAEEVKTEEPIQEKQSESENPKEKKRRVGRPAKNELTTKLYNILERRNMSRRDLYRAVERKFPDEPISPDAISRIVSGTRPYYSTKTLYRICAALDLKPNDILDFEKEV